MTLAKFNNNMNDSTINIFTDASSNNIDFTSRVSSGCIVENNKRIYKFIETYSNKTNNYGELKAIELALTSGINNINLSNIKEINIYSDSLLSVSNIFRIVNNEPIYNSKNRVIRNFNILKSITDIIIQMKNIGITVHLYFVRSHVSKEKIRQGHMKFIEDNKKSITMNEYLFIHRYNNLCDTMVKI